MKNITVVTSIPKFYSEQSFFETTSLLCSSLNRFDDSEILVIVPENYLVPKNNFNIKVIYKDMENEELLMSNVLTFISEIVKTDYFIYFTTENIILKEIDYSKFMNDNFYVVMTDIEENNSYFNFEKTLHNLYYKQNTNKQMILEYMICGKTKSNLWKDFNDLSLKILSFIKQNYKLIKLNFDEDLIKYILPSADLVALNILHQNKTYNFINFPHSFISMHPGLSEKYVKMDKDSLFYQYSGLYHHNVDKFLDIEDKSTRFWLSKEIININPKLSMRLLK